MTVQCSEKPPITRTVLSSGENFMYLFEKFCYIRILLYVCSKYHLHGTAD